MEAQENKYRKELAMFEALTVDMRDIFAAKRKDYGPSTEHLYEKFGPLAMYIKLHDKMSRLENLLGKNIEPSVIDESVIDTLLDLANYALITIIEMHKQKEKYDNGEEIHS